MLESSDKRDNSRHMVSHIQNSKAIPNCPQYEIQSDPSPQHLHHGPRKTNPCQLQLVKECLQHLDYFIHHLHLLLIFSVLIFTVA